MTSRLIDTTKWLWYLLALYTGYTWSPVEGLAVKSPPKNPSTIEAQAKFFQYRHLPTSEDFDQGHRLGSERHFTERHERSRPSEGLFSAKVRWGDKKGGYGEHYWDLNHAGHAGDHGDDDYHGNSNSDDGSYHEQDDNNHNNYDGPSDHASLYAADDYDPEKASYEENGRAKRAHPKIKAERKPQINHDDRETRPKNHYEGKEQLQEAPSHKVEKYTDDNDENEEVYKKKRPQHRSKHDEDDNSQKETKNQVVLVVKEKDTAREARRQTPYASQNSEVANRQADYSQFVPYEGGAGVRQHRQPEVAAASPGSRLFLEPSTGHVVDRATGQAYVLQPIATVTNYN